MSDGAASPGPSCRRARWFFVAGAAAAVLVLAVGGGVFALGGEEDPVEPDHEPAEAAVEAHATPTNASDESWTWDAPEGSTVIDMHALPFGAGVELDDGVVAIDGTSGEEVWHYRRPDATVASASTTPDGQFLALAFEQDASEEESDGDETGESEPAYWDQVVLDASDIFHGDEQDPEDPSSLPRDAFVHERAQLHALDALSGRGEGYEDLVDPRLTDDKGRIALNEEDRVEPEEDEVREYEDNEVISVTGNQQKTGNQDKKCVHG